MAVKKTKKGSTGAAALFQAPRQKKVSDTLKGQSIVKQLLQSSTFGVFRKIINSILPPVDDNPGAVSQATFKLPRVVVIGAEKAGKSTLIENITKCAIFPRAAGLCTKCPIKLCLAESDHLNEPATVQFRSETWTVDRLAILERVTAIMDSIPSNSIVADEITVTLRGPGLPNFEFIDLPGIREFPEDMAASSKELTSRYLADEDTLVLAVVPATAPSLTSNQGIAFVINHRKQARTIIAMPMCDLVQPANFMDRVIDRLLERTTELEGHK
jgi:GTP-binding protein EngB required for normal cell division